jgi:uncharacterized protein (TIGR00251 family)
MDPLSQPQTLCVKVKPHASSNSVEGWVDAAREAVALKVTAPADGGKANAAVTALLSDELGIPKSAITIKRGQTSRHKLLSLDIDPKILQTWLDQL